MAKLVGKNINIDGNEYNILKHITDGGNGSIFEVERNQTKYALKILKEINNNKKERFIKEIDFCKNYKHKNIVPIYASGEINGKLCYIMPLYEMNFAELINKEISLEMGFNYIFKICNALKFLHNKNVIHRDLKPENILVTRNELVLADLGIAHFENSNITTKQDLLANRGYSAPEQKIKGHSKEITTAVDIFSLGLIINEIFTGKKPEGSNFTLVSDVYPWLIDIDELVERCMRQNPNERPTISDILFEIKYINNKLKIESNEIKEYLEYDFDELSSSKICNNKVKNRIIKQAINDILIAKYFLKYKNEEELNKYNSNYNCNIRYKLNLKLRSEYTKYLLKEECKNKFLYESNVYKNGKIYEPLNLNNNEDRIIYEKFQSFLKNNFIVDGELLKLFSSCCNYHCQEILKNLDRIKTDVEELDGASILYIVKHIINIEDINSDLQYDDEILVNWEKSVFFYDMIDSNMGLLNQPYQEYKEMDNILKEFNEKYNSIVTKKGDSFVVRFEEKKSYIAFKKYALELSKPYYFFEGDVLDLIRIEKEYEGIIELKPWNSFDIGNVLAKIMGFRSDY